MVLFDPAQHQPLSGSAWNERRARDALSEIIAHTLSGFKPDGVRSHESREAGSGALDLTLWSGAAGVLWGLEHLGAGLGEAGLYEAYLESAGEPRSPGLMLGEAGVLLVSWWLAPTEAKARRLRELVASNIANPEHELFNGSPGTMLAALHVYEETGEAAWQELWGRCAEVLWERFGRDPELGCRIWIQYRRGRLLRSIGAGHGFASNVRSLLRGRRLLAPARLDELQRAAAETASRLAMRRDGLANWPTAADPYWAEQFPTRVQWCHGAPGIITSLASLPREEQLDELLGAAGELVWRAGPLRKGAGLCHGTAGNGFALLALHERFGDERWLARARAFAMHALEQAGGFPAGPSLWLGDIGVAVYLKACLDGRGGLPLLG